MKKLIALLLVLVMVAGLVACAGSNDETKGNDTPDTTNTENNGDNNNTDDSSEPIYIGLSAKITGADAANGDRMVKAAQMAVDEVNEAGGLLGGRKGERGG